MEVIQINLNHCEVAHNLVWQIMAERECDVAMISEPYKAMASNGYWVTDKGGKAGILLRGNLTFQEITSNDQDGFVIAKVGGIYLCSCYAPPSWTLTEFENMLDLILETLRGRKPVVIAGDLNAWATQWGSARTNQRGQSLMETFTRLDVCIANVGTRPTFQRNGVGESVVDVTFCSPTLASSMNWRVSEEYTGSDHQAIRYKLTTKLQTVHRRRSMGRQWKTATLDKSMLCEVFNLSTTGRDRLTPRQLTRKVTEACDMAMQRRVQPRNYRRPAYWWNDDIAALRTECNKARRRAQRKRLHADSAHYQEVHRKAKLRLKYAIRDSKKTRFRELCEEVNNNPWGQGYQIAKKRLKGPTLPRETDAAKVGKVVETLFPQQDATWWSSRNRPSTPRGAFREDTITNMELIEVARGLAPDKAPGPDGIPNTVLKVLIQKFPDIFRSTFQKCLDECDFPKAWKRQKLVLIPKPGKPPGDASSCRPLCLLDTLGKVLEKLIARRLTEYSEGPSGLSERQFGFRKGRSTADAIEVVLNKARAAINAHRRTGRYCVITTIDVRNAFNCASWTAIDEALGSIKASEHIRELIRDYLNERTLLYETDDGIMRREVTAGVPQGSILGPTLWNIMYDGVLRLELPGKVEITGFADDIVLTTTGDTESETIIKSEGAISTINSWLGTKNLQLAHHKTEVVMVTNRRQPVTIQLEVGDHLITSQRQLRYLGLMLDDRMSFNRQVEHACEKANKVQTALAIIMPNGYGPTSTKRKLLANVTTSVLRYGAEAWVDALETKRNLEMLNRVHRVSAMRIASAYRTISYDAACVVAGLIPIGLLLREDSECRKSKQTEGVTERPLHRERSIREWQKMWDQSPRGRWTYRLIPKIKQWIERRHGEVDFHLTQFLTGHGAFKEYLHRIGKVQSPTCPTCTTMDETAEHVLFVCPRFTDERERMQRCLKQPANADNIVEIMCEDEAAWKAVRGAASKIMQRLAEDIEG